MYSPTVDIATTFASRTFVLYLSHKTFVMHDFSPTRHLSYFNINATFVLHSTHVVFISIKICVHTTFSVTKDFSNNCLLFHSIAGPTLVLGHPKSILAAVLGPLAHPSCTAQPPSPFLTQRKAPWPYPILDASLGPQLYPAALEPNLTLNTYNTSFVCL